MKKYIDLRDEWSNVFLRSLFAFSIGFVFFLYFTFELFTHEQHGSTTLDSYGYYMEFLVNARTWLLWGMLFLVLICLLSFFKMNKAKVLED